MKTQPVLLNLSAKSPKGTKKVWFFSFSTYGHSVLFLTEQNRVPIFFFGPSTFCIHWLTFFSNFQNILSFSNYGHSVLFLTEQNRVPIFFFGPSTFCINLLTFFSIFHNILSSIVSFLILFFTDCYFFIIPESDSLKGQNKPAHKQKKTVQNQSVLFLTEQNRVSNFFLSGTFSH